MEVPIDFVNNSESSDEAFSDSESSYSSEDESMEDEPSGNINGGGESLSSLKREGLHTSLSLSLHFISGFHRFSLIFYSNEAKIVKKILCYEMRSSLNSVTETDRDRAEEEFWVRHPYLKNFLAAIVGRGLIPECFVFERAKLIRDEKAKELDDECKALSTKELELCRMKCELVASAITAMKSSD